MRGQRIGSVRVSTVDQQPERHLEQMPVERVSTDTASGKETTRPALAALRTFVREGETVVVHRMERLARTRDALRRLMPHLAFTLHHYVCTTEGE
jgi:DNA invertase Pin-like site-specific DNA recombinase